VPTGLVVGDIVKPGLMTFTLILLVSNPGAAQRGTGSVCVVARIDDPFWKEPATLPNGEINSHGLKVRVDRRPVEEWPQRKSLKIDGLDISERHLLAVLDSGGKSIESVRFNFGDYNGTDLCTTYDGYQGIAYKKPRGEPLGANAAEIKTRSGNSSFNRQITARHKSD
jgi:hypothetical protein